MCKKKISEERGTKRPEQILNYLKDDNATNNDGVSKSKDHII